jgi:hypothetical protein
MKLLALSFATLFAAAWAGATEESADPFNLEVVSSFIANDFDDDTSPYESINSAEQGINTVKSSLRGLQQLRCSNSQKVVQLTLLTDKFPKDTSWTLKSDSGALIASSPSPDGTDAYEKQTGYQTKYCLDVGTKYTLTVKDDWGDGLQKKGDGFYKLAVETSTGWKVLASGGDFTYKSTDTFSITSNGGKLLSSSGSTATPKPVYAPVPTPSNYAHQDSNNNKPSASKPTFQGTGASIEQFGGGSLLEFTSRMGCPSNQRKARVEIQLDKFGEEITWSLKSSDGKEYMRNSRTYEKFDYEVVEKCLPEDKYQLIVYDRSGK